MEERLHDFGKGGTGEEGAKLGHDGLEDRNAWRPLGEKA